MVYCIHSVSSFFQAPSVKHLGGGGAPNYKSDSQGPKLEARKLPLHGPCSTASSRGKGLLYYRGAPVTESALWKMTWFTNMCMGQANRKKEQLSYSFYFSSVYRDNFPVTHAGLCWGSWCKAIFTKAPWPLPFSGIGWHTFDDFPLKLILPPKIANKHRIRLSGERWPVNSPNTSNV